MTVTRPAGLESVSAVPRVPARGHSSLCYAGECAREVEPRLDEFSPHSVTQLWCSILCERHEEDRFVLGKARL